MQCEGRNYNAKSDVWALGCILYEMACLQRTFEGTNLPALVHKIVQVSFAPVKGDYSTGLKQMVRHFATLPSVFSDICMHSTFQHTGYRAGLLVLTTSRKN